MYKIYCLSFKKKKNEKIFNYKMIFTKRFAFSSIADKILPFAVVGGGPAGLYCAKKLLKNVENIRIDVFEKMPIPFGLIRYGVAPDNQDLKKFQNELATVY